MVSAFSFSSQSALPVPLQSGVDLSSVKMSMNPFCEIAVEVRKEMHCVQAFYGIILFSSPQLLLLTFPEMVHEIAIFKRRKLFA